MNSRVRSRRSGRAVVACALLLVASACQGTDDVAEPTSVGLVNVWFDAPLPDTLLDPSAPCRLIAHASSAVGIASFELTIDDKPVSSIDSPDTEASIVTLTEECAIAEPGRHVIGLRAVDNDARSSALATTSVVVPGLDGPVEGALEVVEPVASTTTTTLVETTTTLVETTLPPTTTAPDSTTPPPVRTTPTVPPPTVPTPTVPPPTVPTPTVPGDTTAPTVTVTHQPSGDSIPEFTFTTFTAVARDDVGVVRIDIVVRADPAPAEVVATCANVQVCSFVEGYPPGDVHYSAHAYDAAGNQVISAETTINYFVVVR